MDEDQQKVVKVSDGSQPFKIMMGGIGLVTLWIIALLLYEIKDLLEIIAANTA